VTTTAPEKQPRSATIARATRETDIELTLDLDGAARADVRTGVGFLDHLLTAMSFHAGFDLTLRCRGDTDVDDHHTAEDCALVLGAAIDRALGDRRGIRRFGWALAPMDEALARAAVDLVRRPYAVVDLGLRRDRVGALACENVPHVLRSLASAGAFTLHCGVEYGENDHHKAEAAFKAVGLALRQASAPAAGAGEGGAGEPPSTKGAM
jgi:imidazoleglycerol-phosphate dehydratase